MELLLPITDSAIEVAMDTINEITENINIMTADTVIDIPSTIRVRLMETGVLGRYANNPLALQEIMLVAQRRIFSNPIDGLNLFYAMGCGIFIYDPILAERTRYGDLSWFAPYRTYRKEVVSACLEHVMQLEDYSMVLNRVFSGISQSVFTPGALWYTLNECGNDDAWLDGDKINLTVNMLANRSDYFHYPGAEEELSTLYDTLMRRAVNIVTNDMRDVTDLNTTLSLSAIPDVASVFSVYGDRDNSLGIDRVALELSENICYRITDALVQCTWDNLEYLLSIENSVSETRMLFDRIVKLYLEVITLI